MTNAFSNDEARMTNDEGSPNDANHSNNDGSSVSDFVIPSSFSIRPSSFDFRQTNHAAKPTAAPPKCAADDTELIPAFCSRVPMIWNKIQRTKTNQAGNRIQRNQMKPQRIRKASRIRGKFRA